MDVLVDFYYGVVTNFAEGSARITFNLNWAFACEMTSLKVSRNVCFGFFSVLCNARILQPSFCRFQQTVFGDTCTSTLNLTKSIRVNTRAKSSSLACIFSSIALKVLVKLVYFFLSSGNQTDYRSLGIVSEKDFLQTGLEVTIPSSRIFLVTEVIFSPQKFKFTVCTVFSHKATVLTHFMKCK